MSTTELNYHTEATILHTEYSKKWKEQRNKNVMANVSKGSMRSNNNMTQGKTNYFSQQKGSTITHLENQAS